MANTYFRIVAEQVRDGALLARYQAGPDTAGPWDPRAQHGGPPNALAVRAAERLAAALDEDTAQREDTAPVAARLASEFLRPIPVAAIDVSARVVRAARSAVLVDVSLAHDSRECLHSRVWLVRSRDSAPAAREAAADPSATAPPPIPDAGAAFGLDFPYARTIDWRPVSGRADVPGPGATWARPRLALVDGEPLGDLQRVALVGDSASGISSALDWGRWSFPNVDLDVHLARPADGDWVYVNAVTEVGPAGFALSRSAVSDRSGPLASTAQTLLVAPRAR